MPTKKTSKRIKRCKPKNRSDIKTVLSSIKLEDFMSNPVISIRDSTKFSDVPGVFKRFKIRHIPIINKNDILVGLITERDLYKIKSPRRLEDGSEHYDADMLNNVILKHVMTKKPVTMSPTDNLGDAIVKMAHHKFGCIPVVDKIGKMVGIISQIDVLRAAAEIYSE